MSVDPASFWAERHTRAAIRARTEREIDLLALEMKGPIMSKLTDTMAQHPEMSAVEITRIEVRKVSEPTLRAGLEALTDLLEFVIERDSLARSEEHFKCIADEIYAGVAKTEAQLIERVLALETFVDMAGTEELTQGQVDPVVTAALDGLKNAHGAMVRQIEDVMAAASTQEQVDAGRRLDALADEARALVARVEPIK